MAKQPRAAPVAVAPDPALLADARAELDRTLLAGGATTAIRQRMASLEREAAALADAEAARLAEIERTEREAIADRASVLAGEASARIASVLTDLQPPPAPWSKSN